MLHWFPSSDVIVFIVSAFSFHWASSYSWEYQSVRKRELESIEWVSRGIFCCGRTFFFPVRFFFEVQTLMQRTPDCECVCKRDREEVHCCPFSLCTQWSWAWFTDEVSSVGPLELLPISTPPLTPCSSWLWEWSMLGDSRTVYVGGSAQGPAPWDLMHVIQISVIREFRGRAVSVRVNVWWGGCGGLRSVYKGSRSSLTDATVQALITGSHSYCYLLITGTLWAPMGWS